MTNPRYTSIAALFLCLLLLSGCASRGIDPTTLTADQLWARATGFFEAENYGRAIPLLDVFVQQHLGDPRAPRARFMLGEAHYERREYVTAATHYQRLLEDFPNSELNLDARFAICESYVQLSPKAQLDQEYTYAALAHCESVATYFPDTPQAERASVYADDMEEKLARKVYLAGEFYQRRKAYDAAIVYYSDVVDQFPGTEVAPMALEGLLETYEALGYVEEAEEAREKLLRDYPESSEAQALRE